MSPPLWFDNLAAYCAQVLLLVIVGGLLPRVFRLRVPKVSVVYWQVLLTACLLLPLLEPWKQLTSRPSISFGSVNFETGPMVAAPVHAAFPTFRFIAVVLVSGVAIRMLWIALGLFRLRQYRKRARFLAPVPCHLKELRSVVAVDPQLLVSDEIEGPGTCGIVDPAVLFPARFTTMDADCQRAIACHEFVHIRRRDWLFNLMEELILAIFWLHPAIWWLVRQIRLTREQAVDREVLQLTEARGPYIQALLDLASGAAVRPPLPAPLFLREGQLTQRVALMLKEVTMSKSRLVLSLAAISVFLLATAVVTVRAFPLKALPIEFAQPYSQAGKAQANTQPADKVESKWHQAEAGTANDGVSGLKPIHRVWPEYPPLAKMAHIQGTVTLNVTVEKNGEVSNIEVVSGHPLLAKAAIDAVLQWRFEPQSHAPVTTTVTVNFDLSKETSDAEKFAEVKARLEAAQAEELSHLSEDQRIVLDKLGEDAKAAELNALLQRRQAEEQSLLSGDQRQASVRAKAEQDKLEAQSDMLLSKVKAIQSADQVQLQEEQLAMMQTQRAQMDAEISMLEHAIRETKSHIKSQSDFVPVMTVAPEYPAQAKHDRVQGTVVLHVTVEQDGAVSNVEVLSGPAVLVSAAKDAVRQWRFTEPPIAPAKTTVTVNFVLE